MEQVKTTERPASWCLISKHAETTASDSHIYVFVTLKGDHADFMVVPSLAWRRTLGGRGRRCWSSTECARARSNGACSAIPRDISYGRKGGSDEGAPQPFSRQA
jgi:hypothetical protein